MYRIVATHRVEGETIEENNEDFLGGAFEEVFEDIKEAHEAMRSLKRSAETMGLPSDTDYEVKRVLALAPIPKPIRKRTTKQTALVKKLVCPQVLYLPPVKKAA